MKFFISVLWRASVSEKFEISLGPFEERARKIIRHEDADYKPYFSTIIENRRFEYKINGVNYYLMEMGYAKIYIKCDKRLWPSDVGCVAVSEENDFLMMEIYGEKELARYANFLKKFETKKILKK